MIWQFVVSAILFSSTPCRAWDQHHFITESALGPIKNQLGDAVTVVDFDSYLSETFPGCTREKFFSRLMQGVTRGFEFGYADVAKYSLMYTDDLQIVTALVQLLPSDPFLKSQVMPGAMISPFRVLSTYSDEPDWNLDSVVTTLDPNDQKADLQPGVDGTGTVLLRHFWFGRNDPYKLGIKTLIHTQRIYDLALASFAAGQNYWGYRFLAHTLHYLQDLTQPFHTKLVPSMRMVSTLELLAAATCDKMKKRHAQNPQKYSLTSSCEKSLSFDQAKYMAGLSVAAYHGIYEGYARELFLLPGSDISDVVAGRIPAPSYVVHDRDSKWFLDRNGISADPNIGEFLDQVAGRTRAVMLPVGYDTYQIFGSDFKERDGIRKFLDTIFTPMNPGALLAKGDFKNSNGKLESFQNLAGLTRDLLSFSGELTRELALQGIHSSKNEQSAARIRLNQECL